MKQFFYSLILLLVCHLAQSQDVIVTNEGDTIDCKITRITNEFIHFSVFDESGFLLIRSRLPKTQIQHYHQGEEQGTMDVVSSSPEIKEEDRFVITEFNPASFRLAVNTGYTYQFGGYEGWPDSYQQQLKSLWNLGADFHYFLSDNLGVGLKYNYIFTNAEEDFDPTIYPISTIRDERIRFSYAAISLMYRNFLYDDQVIQYFIAGGIVNYKTDGLVDGSKFYEEGDTFGLAIGVTYDFLFTENFGMGAGVEVNVAKLTEINTSRGPALVDFSLTRVDLTLGIRLYK
ncbi:hypothetical protein [Ekhidna sp.]|uniref:hypothetical protein n=1 Tax=Ekhidna sp. TaxID=2608089 RepID=UPI003B5CC353